MFCEFQLRKKFMKLYAKQICKIKDKWDNGNEILQHKKY
jgi:hypothetical protein